MVLQGEEIEAELARERQLKHLKQGTKESLSVPDLMSLSSPSPSMEICTNGERAGRKVDEILAEQAGVSPSTFSRGKYIIKHGSEDMKKELREGHLHIDPAYKKLGAMGDPTATEVEENTNPIQVEEQANDFEMDVAIDTLIRLTYSAAPNLVDLVIPSWAFTNDRIDDII